MPENRYIQQVPTDWLGVTGNTWQITGLQVVNPSANLVHIDSTTGRASGFYYNELGAASTGVYAASGQFSTPDPVVAWGLVHPANNEIITENYAQDPFFQGFEISILDRDGTVKTGLGSIDDGRISQVELVSGGSGYMNPTVFVSGDGTGAKIEIETFGTGLFTEISGYSLSTSGVSGYQTGIASIKIISGGSGYTAGNTHLVISGSGNDEYTIGQLATISQGGDAESNQGSGAFVTIPSTGFGLKKFYYDNSFVQIPISVNREVFGGDGERDFQVQVVTRDYYSNLTTGRIQLNFPAPRFENFEPIKTSNEIIFGVTASGRIEQDKDFLENSLQKLEIHRGPTSDFSVVTGSDISNTKIFTQEFIENQSQGLSEITLTSDLFDDSDYYSGYFYKLLPYDNFGTGDILSIETGIRISRNTEIVDVPSGFRTLVDQSKGVGTNIQGDVITNTYLSWKKDKRFNIEQYEVVVEDQVEQESYTATVAVPQVSGINYIVSGTGSGRADFDQDSLVQLKTDTLERTVFDVFQPYSSNGVQWSAHTVYLDSEYLGNVDVQSIGPTSIRESVERPFVEVAAGNSASGYLYYTGVGDSISYAGADSFLSVGDQQEPHALVARNVNGEVIVEYEPRIKIPTKKDGSYSFKVRGITNKGEKSLYGETQTFTASGAKSHFSFNPTNTNLELGGTGTIVSSGPFVTTVGGKNITAVGTGVVLVGGMDNSVTGEMSALVGGSGNRLMGAEGPPAEASFMGGGRLNVISGFKNVLVGGEENIISGDGHALLGGRRNSIFNLTDEPHIFEPGQEDEISFEQSVIGGGLENLISGDNSFIGGGNNNTIGINLTRASGTFGVGINTANANRQAQFSVLNSAIVGGRDNELYSSYGFIGGGYGNRMSEGSNTVKAFGNAIVGGRDNLITGASTLGTVVLGGRYNEGRAPYTVIGGYKSSGDGSYGVALGAYAYSNHDGAMVLADGTEPTEVLGAQSKNSVEKHSLNLFFENGTYVRNGDLYVSGDATVTGNLTVLGSFTLGDTTTDTLTSVGEIITTDYVSGISGYFGKVGIGSSTIDEDAILQVTKPDVADPSRTEVARFLAITAAGNTNSSLRVSSAVAGSQTSGRYVDLSVFDHNPTSRPLILQRDGGQVGIGTSIPDGAMLKVNGDASITGDLSVATDIYVGDKIRHLGDSNTYLEFSNDLIYLKAGDINLLELREVGTDYVAVGGLASNTADVDFYVNTEVAGQDYAFVVDAGLPAVGVNIAPGDAKGAALVVSGDASITGELRAADSTNNVGFGVAPVNKLHVHGHADGYGYIRITDGTTNATATDGCRIGYNSAALRIQNYENSNISFFTNNTTEALTIKNDGNIGIGTTSPNELLHVEGTNDASDISIKVKNLGTSNATQSNLDLHYSTADRIGARISSYLDDTSSNSTSLRFWTRISNSAKERMRLSSDGYLMIAPGDSTHNTDPEAMLTVSGDASITGELAITEKIVHGGDTDTYFEFGADRVRIHAGGVELIDAREAGTDYVAIGGLDDNPDVNLLVGSAVNGIDYVLEVDAGSSTVGINCDPLDAKGSALVVSGDASISGQITVSSVVSSNSSNDLDLQRAGSNRITLGGSSVTINDNGENIDFRVEGDNNANLIRTDAANDRVGIGTNAPSERLHIGAAGADVTRSLRIDGTNGSSEIAGFIIKNDGENGRVEFQHNVGNGTPVPRMKLDNFGNLLIGDGVGSTQGAKLTVSGDASITGSVTAVGQIRTAGGALATPSFGFTEDAGLGISRPTTQALNFITSSTERMRIDSAGDLMVGNTTVAPVTSHSTQKGLGFDISEGELEIAAGSVQGPLALGRTTAAGMGVMTDFRQASNTFGTIKGKSTGGNYGNLEIDATGHLLLQENGGNVGIGTEVPTAKLTVYDADTKFEVDPDNNRIRLRDNVFISGDVDVSGDIAAITSGIVADEGGYVSGSSGFFGRVGIGTTAIYQSSLLEVKGDTTNGQFLAKFTNDGSQSEDNGILIDVGTAGRTANAVKVTTGGRSNAFIINGEGRAGLGLTASNMEAIFTVNGGASITGDLRVGDGTDKFALNTNVDATMTVQSHSNNENVLDVRTDDGSALFSVRQSADDCLVRGYKAGTQTFAIHGDGPSFITGGHFGIGISGNDVDLSALKVVMPASSAIGGGVHWPDTISDTNPAFAVHKGFNNGSDDSDVEVARFGASRAKFGAAAGFGGHFAFYQGAGVGENAGNTWGAERFRVSWDGGTRGYFGKGTDRTVGIYAATNQVQIVSDGTQHVNPQATLVVSGDASITGELRTNSSSTFGGNISIPAGNLLYLDGGSNTYMYQDSADSISLATNSIIRWTADNNEFCVNDDSNDMDFRVESNGQTHMLFVDGGNNRVGIGMNELHGSFAPSGLLHIKGTNTAKIILENTTNATDIDIDYYNNGNSVQSRIRYSEGPGAFYFQPNIAKSAATILYNGNFGIGTASPDSLLHLDGSAPTLTIEADGNTDDPTIILQRNNNAGLAARIQLDNSAGDVFFDNTYDHDNGDIFFRTKGTTKRVTIKGAGNVGIGTTDPAALLTVSGANATVRINTPTTTDSDTAMFSFGLNAAADLAGMKLDYTDRVASGLALFVHPAYGYPISLTPSTDKDILLNVVGDGNVGIGINAPDAKFHVQGDDPQIRIGDNAGTNKFIDIRSNNGNAEFVSRDNAAHGTFKFITEASTTELTRMTILADGKVGIGTETPEATLQVDGDASITGQLIANDKIILGNTSPGHVRDIDFRRTANSINPTARIRVLEPAATHTSAMTFSTSDADGGVNLAEVMRIDQNGQVGIGTTSPSKNLHVYSTDSVTTTRIQSNPGGNSYAHLDIEGYRAAGNAGNVGIIVFNNHNGNVDLAQITCYNDSAGNDRGDLIFATRSTAGEGLTTRMEIPAVGPVEFPSGISGHLGTHAYARYGHMETAGGDGGSATADSYTDKEVSHALHLEQTGCAYSGFSSFNSANYIMTLDKGQYYVRWTCPGWNVGYHHTRLRDADVSTTYLVGTTAKNNSSSYSTNSDGAGTIYLERETNLKMQHFCTKGAEAYNFGYSIDTDGSVSASDYDDDIYWWIEFWKVSGPEVQP